MWRELVSTLRDRPDEIVLDIGAGGELLVARVRLAVTVLLMLIPLVNFLAGGRFSETLIGLAATGGGAALSLLWLVLARHPRRYAWLPFATSASDITMETLVMVMVAATQSPAASLNTVIIWTLYPVSIFATALRNDGRLTLFTGLLAIVEYGSLVTWAFVQAGPHAVLYSHDYGVVSVNLQIQRLVVMLVLTALTAVVVYRIQRLVLQSGTDTLTGLPNRTYLVHRVPQIILHSRESDTSITLAILDLDGFKAINEAFGHPVGDRALRHVVETIGDALAEDEPLMRVGGEEFVLLMPRSIGPAWERMEVLRERVATSPLVLAEGPGRPHTLTVTFSAGLASCPNDGIDVSHLMRKADARLLKAKRSGRNRVVARE
jgi:diguanylate cyclase (GGDEF)-like protein